MKNKKPQVNSKWQMKTSTKDDNSVKYLENLTRLN